MDAYIAQIKHLIVQNEKHLDRILEATTSFDEIGLERAARSLRHDTRALDLMIKEVLDTLEAHR